MDRIGELIKEALMEAIQDILYPETEFVVISEDVLLAEDLVRVDNKRVNNFNRYMPSYLATQTFRPDQYESGASWLPPKSNRTPYRSNEEDKAIKVLQKRKRLRKFNGVHVIDTKHPMSHQIGHYLAPRHIRSFIHNHPEHGPTITFRESDREEIGKYRPWLTTVRDSNNTRITTGAERVSKTGAKVQIQSQEQVHPIEHLKKLGLNVRFVPDDQYAEEHRIASRTGTVSTEGSVD